MPKICFISLIVIYSIVTSSLYSAQSSQNSTQMQDITYLDETITIVDSDVSSFSISIRNLSEMKLSEIQVIDTDDFGNEKRRFLTKGVFLAELLSLHGINIKELQSMRVTSKDGYSIKLDQKILNNRKIILAFLVDGKPLWERQQPLRLFVKDETPMYWVGGLSKLRLVRKNTVSEDVNQQEIEKAYFLETLINITEQTQYPDTSDNAVKMQDILSDKTPEERVYFAASDSFNKVEELSTVLKGYLIIDGEHSPHFKIPRLSKGMYIKNVFRIITGKTAFIHIGQLRSLIENDSESIPLAHVLKKSNLKQSEFYKLVNTALLETIVSTTQLKDIMLDLANGEVTAVHSNKPEEITIKNLLYIEAIHEPGKK